MFGKILACTFLLAAAATAQLEPDPLDDHLTQRLVAQLDTDDFTTPDRRLGEQWGWGKKKERQAKNWASEQERAGKATVERTGKAVKERTDKAAAAARAAAERAGKHAERGTKAAAERAGKAERGVKAAAERTGKAAKEKADKAAAKARAAAEKAGKAVKEKADKAAAKARAHAEAGGKKAAAAAKAGANKLAGHAKVAAHEIKHAGRSLDKTVLQPLGHEIKHAGYTADKGVLQHIKPIAMKAWKTTQLTADLVAAPFQVGGQKLLHNAGLRTTEPLSWSHVKERHHIWDKHISEPFNPVKEGIDNAKEGIAKAKEGINKAKEEYDEAKEKYDEVKESVDEAMTAVEKCMEKGEENCYEKGLEVVFETKMDGGVDGGTTEHQEAFALAVADTTGVDADQVTLAPSPDDTDSGRRLTAQSGGGEYTIRFVVTITLARTDDISRVQAAVAAIVDKPAALIKAFQDRQAANPSIAAGERFRPTSVGFRGFAVVEGVRAVCRAGAKLRTFGPHTCGGPAHGNVSCEHIKQGGSPCQCTHAWAGPRCQQHCPVAKCAAPKLGCKNTANVRKNAESCPTCELVCEMLCTHTKCSFISLPHKIGAKAVTVMQVTHDNKEGICSRHETISKNNWAFHDGKAHCAMVSDKTNPNYGTCRCHLLGFHPNGNAGTINYPA